jgi:tetratricopeptide (TPR) repeat protein
MTPEQSRLFADYILGMPDRNAAVQYLRFSAFRLDDTFFSELRTMIAEATRGKDGSRRTSLEWLRSAASDACGRAYAPFDDARARSGTAGPKASDDHSRAMRVIQVDRRVMGMMMRTHFNPADQTVITDWQNIAGEYRELIAAGPPATPFYTVESLRLKYAQALESLARAYDALHDSRTARTAYAQAASAFDEAGEPLQAAQCRSRAAESTLTEDARYDDQLRAILEDLEHLDQAQPAYFSRLIDLGELQAQAGDDFAAEQTLLKAEDGLKGASWENPSGSDLAEALVATLKGLQSGERLRPGQDISTALSARGLHRRIHLALSDVHRRSGDADRADARLKLADAMDRSSPDDEFSKTMLNRLAGEWKDLFR